MTAAPGRAPADHDWLDDDAGPVVRPYAMTGGRARPITGGLDLVALRRGALRARGRPGSHLQPEHRAILSMPASRSRWPRSPPHLDLAVGVVRVLLGDLLQAEPGVHVRLGRRASTLPTRTSSRR